MSEWKPYFNNRLRRDNPKGFVVIVPVETTPVVPLKCPVCEMLLSTADDAEAFRARGCCYRCRLKWADPNKDRWESGWRPTPEDVVADVKARQSLPLSLNLDAFGK